MSMQRELELASEALIYTKPTISAIILSAKDEDFIDLTLKSLIGMVDQVVIVGDLSNDLHEKIAKIKPYLDYRLNIYYRKWDGNYGAARNEALGLADGEWIISIDADEVLSDSGFLLRDHAKNGNINNVFVYDFKMDHFIRDLGHVDNTLPVHHAINRFFRKFPDCAYSDGTHEIVTSLSYVQRGVINDIMLYHLGYLKNILTVVDKYLMNLKNSKVHSKEFLDSWKKSHIEGTFPTRAISTDEIQSQVIREAFIL
jgi:glycosyltransferase involved in cell wall biosynthesis